MKKPIGFIKVTGRGPVQTHPAGSSGLNAYHQPKSPPQKLPRGIPAKKS